jgi:hypothetical protein
MRNFGSMIVAAALVAVPMSAADARPIAAAASSNPTTDQLVALFTREGHIAQLQTAFVGLFLGELKSDPEFADLEAAHPGMIASLTKALDKVLGPALRTHLPALRSDLAATISDGLTPEEQQELLRFKASPVGQKLEAIDDSLYDQDKVEALAEQKSVLTQADVLGAVDRSVAAQLSKAEWSHFVDFSATSAGRKWPLISLQLTGVALEWLSDVVDSQDAAVDKAMEAAVTPYVAADEGTST